MQDKIQQAFCIVVCPCFLRYVAEADGAIYLWCFFYCLAGLSCLQCRSLWICEQLVKYCGGYMLAQIIDVGVQFFTMANDPIHTHAPSARKDYIVFASLAWTRSFSYGYI